MIRPLFFLSVILLYSQLHGQQLETYRQNTYTTENGLPANGIKGMQWDDKTGFLWIATEAGISRFNGIDFKNFTIANTPFISSERMSFMVKNNEGKIITVDQEENQFFVNQNRIEYYGKFKKAKPGFFNNKFAINVSEKLLMDKSPFQGTIPSLLTFDQVLPISNEACYFIHEQILYYFHLGMTDFKRCSDPTRIKNGFKIKDHFFVLDLNGKILEINGPDQRHTPVSITTPEGSRFTPKDKDGRIFWNNGMAQPILVIQNKSWTIDLWNKTLQATPLCNNIPTDAFIYCVQITPKKDIIFIGTDSKGIVVLTKNNVRPMKALNANINERNAYYSQIILQNGNILTNQGAVIGSAKMDGVKIPIQGKFNFKTSSTGDSLIWYTQFAPQIRKNCLFKYDKRNQTTTCYTKIIGGEIIVVRLKSGEYAMTTEYGVGKLEGDSIHYLIRYPEISYSNESYSFVEIMPQVILMASCSGIIQLDLKKAKADTLLKSQGYCVRTLWQYKDYVFFGTYGKGIFVLKNGILRNLPLDKRKYLLYAHCFQPDEFGFCWISTNRGLFKASISEMTNAYENNNSVIYYHYLGKNSGMDITEMNGGCSPCAIQLHDSTISFPTMDGLLWVKPKKTELILPAGDIFVEDIYSGGNAINISDIQGTLQLSEKSKDLSINLAYSAWCGKENIYLDYQINDTVQWTAINSENDGVIRINNLTPGQYTLRIRKLNGFGLNNYSFKSISFFIPTPWHQSWWFYLLILVFLFGLIILFVNYRTRRLKLNQIRLEKLVFDKTIELHKKNETLEKNDNIKTRLISIISHDIITPLKFLHSAGKNLLEKRKQMPEELQQETISEITNTSQELHSLSTNILNWIKYQSENRRLTKEQFCLHDLVEQVFSVLNSLARHKEIRLVNEVSKELHISEYAEVLKIVIYNLVNNAINFTDKGSIRVEFREENGKQLILVKDEGTGMSHEQIQHVMSDDFIISSVNVDKRKGTGLGYLIIKDLLKMMKAELKIDSKKGKGTEVTILLSTARP